MSCKNGITHFADRVTRGALGACDDGVGVEASGWQIDGRRRRVSAADSNGRVGSAEQPVAAELRRLGNFTVSQILNGWTSPNGERLLALEALPAGVATIHTSIELYPDDAAAMATDITVRFEFARIGDKTAIVTRDVQPLAAGTVLTARTDIPVSDLGPGSYSIVATILQAGTEKGTVTAVIRKASVQ